MQGQHFVASRRRREQTGPKKQQKRKAQKTLKERWSEKRAAKKLGSSSFLPADK